MQDEKKCALKSPFGGTQFHEKSICLLHQVDKHLRSNLEPGEIAR